MNRCLFFYFHVIIFYSITFAQIQDEEIFSDVFVVDSSSVYITSVSKYILTYPGDIINAIYKTTDGGLSWRKIETNISDKINNIYFASLDTGYISGYYSNKLFKTVDGGGLWDSVFTFSNEIRDLKFLNSKIGFAAMGSDQIYKTTDGGYNWTYNFSGSYQFRCSRLSIVNKNIVYASSWYSDLSKSIDCGENWNIMNSVITNYLIFISDMQFLDEHRGYIKGNGVYNNNPNLTGPYLLKTVNGGLDWTKKLFSPGISITDMEFVDFDEGWLLSSNGSIYHSTNQFTTFDSTQLSINRFDFFNNKISFGISDKVIFKTNNGWQTYTNLFNISDVSKEVKVEINFSLQQNFPNPFNPSTKIKYNIPSAGNVTIKVFDVLGEEVKTLVDEYKDAGSYEADFSANDLSSGVYFYKIATGSYSEIKKMVLLR